MNITDKLKNAINDYNNGDKNAFSTIYEESRGYIYTCVNNTLNSQHKDEDLIADIIQDTYIDISKDIKNLENVESFLPWAATIAKRKTYSHLKKNGSYVLLDESETFDNIMDESNILPEDIVLSKEKQERVRQAINDNLTDAEKECVIGYYYNDMKQKDIAKQLEISENTVASNLFRAKSKMRKALEGMLMIAAVAGIALLLLNSKVIKQAIKKNDNKPTAAPVETTAPTQEYTTTPTQKQTHTHTHTQTPTKPSNATTEGASEEPSKGSSEEPTYETIDDSTGEHFRSYIDVPFTQEDYNAPIVTGQNTKYTIPANWNYTFNKVKLGQYFSWEAESNGAMPGPDANGYLFGFSEGLTSGCSTWCGTMGYTHTATASSTLASNGSINYSADNLILDPHQYRVKDYTWCEGVEGDGIGESITISQTYNGSSYPWLIYKEICIVNGYAKNSTTWTENNRIKKMKLYFGDTYMGSIELEDTILPQYIDISELKMSVVSGKTATFRVEIEEVYKGTKYDDTCLTGLIFEFEGRTAH